MGGRGEGEGQALAPGRALAAELPLSDLQGVPVAVQEAVELPLELLLTVMLPEAPPLLLPLPETRLLLLPQPETALLLLPLPEGARDELTLELPLLDPELLPEAEAQVL